MIIWVTGRHESERFLTAFPELILQGWAQRLDSARIVNELIPTILTEGDGFWVGFLCKWILELMGGKYAADWLSRRLQSVVANWHRDQVEMGWVWFTQFHHSHFNLKAWFNLGLWQLKDIIVGGQWSWFSPCWSMFHFRLFEYEFSLFILLVFFICHLIFPSKGFLTCLAINVSNFVLTCSKQSLFNDASTNIDDCSKEICRSTYSLKLFRQDIILFCQRTITCIA